MTTDELQGLRLAFVGSGTMAEAMIQALLRAGEVTPEQIVASGPRIERGEELQTRYGVRVTTSNVTAASEADIVVLSVKPQVLLPVLAELRGHVQPAALVFSIVAGMPIATICAGLDHTAVVRTMPNTPAQIGEGMTVWTAAPAVTEPQRAQAQTILQTMGLEMYVTHEDALNMATAVSGTGPTYVFLLMEALVDAAVHLGFSRRQARLLVVQTVLGSVKFAQRSDLHLAQLRNMVTSPGGTSAEAIYQLEKGGMRTILSKAIWAAYKKSRLLGERAQQPIEGPLEVGGKENSS
ncbi:MAG: pyrroline-5-carboxylate reductase [Anaerolineae bacterium]|nr:pyrroline-5-carboxylate reductase [Anaerolineae bacterium]